MELSPTWSHVPIESLIEQAAEMRRTGGAWMTQRAELIEAEITARNRSIIIMVGYPGSGKSTIARELGGTVISGDVLKTSAKMIKAAEEALRRDSEQSIIFDATNATRAKRAEYVAFARRHNRSVRCIHVATPIEVSMDRNRGREKPVPNIALYLYRKKFEVPVEEEGFTVS